ncbi:extracellular solute-binding protein [Chamaesiphon sp. GL140_3_metabinner_50]|uniref:extracellular solute-binding protein n=1 Tax=Chamaesiphon sp. GL140_3_metabinner_50 TaxID=2970812 RepID=UPI0025FC4A3E|nr:extracellular solute-binding protein [Chamaesiphon sp. GL140_3_metabinner_50]
MQRRHFLVTLGSLALGSGLTSCQNQDRAILRLLALKNSIPSQLLGEFSKSIQPTDVKVELVGESQFKEVLTQLQEWAKTGKAEAKGLKVPLVPPAQSAEYIPNLVSIGDAWLLTAIQEKLIQPIAVKDLQNWGKLESRWRELPQRDDRGNNSANGQIWGVPYRWGTTVIIYRRDRLKDANIPIPTDWADLWNPQLRQRISVLDRSREVIGLTLKKLGYSYNLADLSQAIDLNLQLTKLHQQVKFYSADNYLQPLVTGDTWVAVGWSSDAIDVIEKNPNIGAIVPASGTAMFADLWVQPAVSSKLTSAERLAVANDNRTKLNRQWLDYCLQPKTSEQISIFTNATAPLLTSLAASEISPDLKSRALVLPPKNVLDKSEFIYPLSSKSKEQYDRLWREIRNAKVNI